MCAKKYYSGIGSRKTPREIRELMTEIAEKLAERNYILRSGASPGADAAFEKGARNMGGSMEIYLPFADFMDHSAEEEFNYIPSDMKNYSRGIKLADKYHYDYECLSQESQKFIVRDVYQVLGRDLNTPSEFVIAWTADGCKNGEERTQKTGGTGQAIAVASAYNVPVYNLKLAEDREKLMDWLDIESNLFFEK